MNTYEIVAVVILAILILYAIVIKPMLEKAKFLDVDTINMIDYACEKGVNFAEQLYKSGENVDRKQLAIDFVFDVLEKAGILPDEYLNMIEAIIEDKVLHLPKTHMTIGVQE